MRIRLPLRRTIFFVAAFFFSLVALIPLRVAAGWFGADGFAAREAEGSVWLGMLKEAQFGRVPLGDLSARLEMLPLVLGRARLRLAREDADGGFEGAVSVSRHSFGIDDLSGRLRLGALFAPLPIAALDLDDVSVRFAGGLCESAGGSVRATLSGDVAGIALSSGLRGSVRCAQGALLLPLASQAASEQLNLWLSADGSYRLEVALRPGDVAARDRAAAAGFTPQGASYVRRLDGSF